MIVDKLPSTRYQGSKRKLIPWIYESIKDLKFKSALDLFGGSGIVSYLLKKMNKKVTYNDYLKFNYLIGDAIIENSSVLLNDEDVKYILKKNGDGKKTFVRDTFGGIYYTDEENLWIDNVTQNIVGLKEIYYDENLKHKQAMAYYALFQSCLVKRPFNLFHRKNLYIRTNEVQRSFGNKTSWDTPFVALFYRFVDEVNSLVCKNGENNRAMNRDAFSIDTCDYDLVYIDPPYFSKDRSLTECDYSRMYHFLEGLANYDYWGNLIDFNSSNLHLQANGYQWPEKRTLKNKIKALIETFKESIIVLSYKSPGIPSECELISMVNEYKESVVVKKIEYKYALSKMNGKPNNNIELLIIGK